MQKTWDLIIGIDVSKKTFDMAIQLNVYNASVIKACFANNFTGYDKMINWLIDQKLSCDKALVCIENTGIYHRLLVQYLLAKDVFTWVETPVQIKWSGGIQRGKSDVIDAERIMSYAYRNQDKAKSYKPKDKSLQQVADYLSLRGRLQGCIQTLNSLSKSSNQ
jgi:transposase